MLKILCFNDIANASIENHKNMLLNQNFRVGIKKLDIVFDVATFFFRR